MSERDDTFRVLGIPGSLRRGSHNRRLLEAARDLAPAGVEVDLVDLASLPFDDGDVEAAGDPPAVGEPKRRARAADALLIATPEYNGAVPGRSGTRSTGRRGCAAPRRWTASRSRCSGRGRGAAAPPACSKACGRLRRTRGPRCRRRRRWRCRRRASGSMRRGDGATCGRGRICEDCSGRPRPGRTGAGRRDRGRPNLPFAGDRPAIRSRPAGRRRSPARPGAAG